MGNEITNLSKAVAVSGTVPLPEKETV